MLGIMLVGLLPLPNLNELAILYMVLLLLLVEATDRIQQTIVHRLALRRNIQHQRSSKQNTQQKHIPHLLIQPKSIQNQVIVQSIIIIKRRPIRHPRRHRLVVVCIPTMLRLSILLLYITIRLRAIPLQVLRRQVIRHQVLKHRLIQPQLIQHQHTRKKSTVLQLSVGAN